MPDNFSMMSDEEAHHRPSKELTNRNWSIIGEELSPVQHDAAD
jgi:hypothetical protein